MFLGKNRGGLATAVFFLLLLSLAFSGIPASLASGVSHAPMQTSDTTWELLDTGYPGGVFWDVAFLNSTHGWMVGSENTTVGSDLIVLHTEDSGDSWALQFRADFGFGAGLDIVDEWNVWVTGNHGLLYYTVDGGVTWNESDVVGASGGMSTVEFTNRTHGWTANNEVLYRTQNGGMTWEAIPAWDFDDHPNKIQVLTHTDMWACGFRGTYLSRDGGETWFRSSSRGGWALSFVSETEGWVVGDNRLAHTVDGETWEELTVPMRAPLFRLNPPYTRDIQFVDADNGWIVGDEIKVMYTPNGGSVWYEQSTPSSVTDGFNAVHFINETHGWAAGYGGIVRTGNGNALGRRLWMGITDPYFLSIVGVVVATIAVAVSGIGIRRWRRTRRVSQSMDLQ